MKTRELIFWIVMMSGRFNSHYFFGFVLVSAVYSCAVRKNLLVPIYFGKLPDAGNNNHWSLGIAFFVLSGHTKAIYQSVLSSCFLHTAS